MAWVPRRAHDGATRLALFPFGEVLALGSLLVVAAPVVSGSAGGVEYRGAAHILSSASRARNDGRMDPRIVRSRSVRIDLDSIVPATAGPPPRRVSLDLFGDAVYEVTLSRVDVRSPTRYTWYGTVTGDAKSLVVLAVENGAVMGTIALFGGKTFQIRYAGNGCHAVYEVACPRERACGVVARRENESIVPVSPASDPKVAPPVSLAEDTEVDILVAYTTAARDGAGGTDAIRALASLAVGETNAAFQNSHVNVRLRLVYATEVSYEESGSSPTDLSRLQNSSDGFMDGVHALRDAYGADLVCLLTHTGDYLGYAYITSTPQTAFSVVGWGSAAAPAYIFAHEVGHNLGAGHARPVGPGGKFNYSYGYWSQQTPSAWRTIVASYGGELIPYYSNPQVSYNGEPTGVDSSDVANSANNAQTISLHAPIVATFRNTVNAVPPSPPDEITARSLLQAIAPNPFTRTTLLTYALPRRELVHLVVLDPLGRKIRSVVGEVQDPGLHSVGWDGRDGAGVLVPSGVYVCRIEVSGTTESRRLVRLR